LKCDQQGFQHAVSDPCFEIWVLYHQDAKSLPKVFKDSDTCKKAGETFLKDCGGYDKLVSDKENIKQAIENAKTASSESQGTHFYKLIEHLLPQQ
jgi:hypothetical protein